MIDDGTTYSSTVILGGKATLFLQINMLRFIIIC